MICVLVFIFIISIVTTAIHGFLFQFCEWPTAYTLKEITPTVLVRTRMGARLYDIPDKIQIQAMVQELYADKYIRNRVVFIVHGYLGSINTPWLARMAAALLSVEDNTVFITGWGKGADLISFPQAASNTQTVAAAIAAVMQSIKVITTTTAVYFFCIGHSLGAHICGQAGHIYPFDRVTGLDPAGPGFQSCQTSFPFQLSNASAACVDVIHTNGQCLGTMQKLGHIDFYANCGREQPGCVGVSCSHSRVIDYFIESILAVNLLQYPSAHGPCDNSFINSCQPCGIQDCATFENSCLGNSLIVQPVGYGSICYDGKVPKCVKNLLSTNNYYGAYYIPVTCNPPYFRLYTNCSDSKSSSLSLW